LRLGNKKRRTILKLNEAAAHEFAEMPWNIQDRFQKEKPAEKARFLPAEKMT